MSSVALVARDIALRRADLAAVEARCGRGLAGLTALREHWLALARCLPDARFYHQYAWHLSYLCNLERHASSVHFYSFFRNGRPVAIFPLRWGTRTVAGVLLRVWELPFQPHMDLCDFLAAPNEDSTALLCRLLGELDKRPEYPWDALCLPQLADGSIGLRAVQAAPLSLVRVVRTGRSMYFRCDNLVAALCNTSGAFRRNLNRQRRKLDKRGRVEVVQVRTPDMLEAAFADFLRIEASGWKGARGSGSAILLHHEIESFYRDLMIQFSAGQQCAINLLKLDGKPIAAQYCLGHGKRVELLKIAYDETYSTEAPGNRLLYDVLAQCCAPASRIAELSLVSGPPWAIGRWNPEARDVWRAEIFNTSPRGFAAFVLARVKPALRAVRSRFSARREAEPLSLPGFRASSLSLDVAVEPEILAP